MSNDLGIDRSGNGNNWTVNNLAYSDQMVDSPTNNFCTLNPLDIASDTLLEGNLKTTGGQDYTWNKKIGSTMSTSTTKIYFEVYQWRENGESGGTGGMIGISPVSVTPISSKNYSDAGAHYSIEEGIYYYNGGTSTSGQTTGQAGVIGMCAYDPNTGKVWFGVNGTWNGSGNPATGANPAVTLTASDKEMSPFLQPYNTGFVANFGQDSSFAAYKTAQGNQDGNDIGDFYYTPPTGYLALCTKNLPDVAVTPSEHFNTILYTGDDATGKAITGVGFSPSFIWFKERNNTAHHVLHDAVRGASGGRLSSNRNNAEDASTSIASFDSDGFTVGSSAAYINSNNANIVAWNWKANGSGSSNTNGSINTTSTSANVDAGFSISTYTSNGTAGATVGHGLSKAPELVMIKNRDAAYEWAVAESHTGSGFTSNNILFLDLTNAYSSSGNIWNSTAPSSSLVTLGDNLKVNGSSSHKHIMYCFHSVDGYSKCGSYTGSGGTDGTFVYTGFRPAFVLIKRSNSAGQQAPIYDSARDTYNETVHSLKSEDSVAELTNQGSLDLLSNGFKARNNEGSTNTDGGIYIYLAFAETPFKYSNAR